MILLGVNMKKSKLEAIVETIEGIEDILNQIRLELDDEVLDDIAFDSLSAVERLRDSLNIQILYGSEE